MSYFDNRPGMLYLFVCTCKEWFTAFFVAAPFVLGLIAFEWLFSAVAHVSMSTWFQVLYLLLGSVLYAMIAYMAMLSIYDKIRGKEATFASVWSRFGKRLLPLFVSLLVTVILVYLALGFMFVLLVSHSHSTFISGLFKQPAIIALVVGGVGMVITYLFFLWAPMVLIAREPLFRCLFRSVSSAVGSQWRQVAVSFVLFVALGLLVLGRNAASTLMISLHLKPIYDAICYGSLGVWLLTYIALLVDAHSGDDPLA